tara:strand:+ start:854 stop:1138 length:285 start_codon:yes stop_codon:yes gene_type:complete
MTFPGAETMNEGIIGDDCFLLPLTGLRGFLEPWMSVFSRASVISTICVRGGISSEGEGEGLVSEGVSIGMEVVLELEREWVLVFRGFPPNVRLV